MGRLHGGERRALEEAAGWFMRLAQDNVSETTIDGFFAWRAHPANRAAYAEVEARMAQAEQLRNDPELVRMTEAVLRDGRRKRGFGPLGARWIAPFGLAAMALSAAVVLVLALRPLTYSTEVGAQQIIRLQDGSVVRLNTDSKVQVRYGPRERQLVLERGEAYFEVAHDEARPFLVQAGDARVRALGTKFDVRRAEGGTHVTLVEGRVEVARTGRSGAWTLNPNEQITLQGEAPRPRRADVTQATSWTTGRLRFLETPLASAVDEVNRYSRTKIVLEAGELAQVRINGAFETGDTAAFVSAVTELFGLTADRSAGAIVLRANHPPRG